MKRKWIQRLTNMAAQLKSAWVQWPMTLLCMMSASVIMMIYIRDLGMEERIEDSLLQWAMTLLWGALFFVWAETLAYRFEKPNKALIRWIVNAAAAVFVVLYRLFLLSDLSFISAIRFVSSVVLTLLLIFLFTDRDRPFHPERIVLRAVLRIFFAGVYLLVIWGGVSFTFFAFSTLMNVELWDRVYFDILMIAVGFIIPAWFLSGWQKSFANKPVEDESAFFKTLLGYILIPILLAYTAVLYLYFVRLLFLFEWPQGMLGHLVFWYALAGTGVYIFIRPFYAQKKITTFFYTFFPWAVIIPLFMMGISVMIRINAYGVTETRYYVLIGGIWMLFCALSTFFRTRLRNVNQVMLIALAVTVVLSGVGPISSYAVSIRNQNQRLEALLSGVGYYDEPESFDFSNMDEADRASAGSIVRYMLSRHRPEDMKAIPAAHRSRDDLLVLIDFYHFENGFVQPRKNPYFYVEYEGTVLTDISEYDFLYVSEPEQANAWKYGGQTYVINLVDDHIFTVLLDDVIVASFDLKAYIRDLYVRLPSDREEAGIYLSEEQAVIYGESEHFSYALHILYAYGYEEDDFWLSRVTFHALIRMLDQPNEGGDAD